MLRRLGPAIATSWVTSLPHNVLFEDEADHQAAQAILSRYADKDFSYTDAVSFVLMERLGIPTAFTFDARFRQYGLDVMP